MTDIREYQLIESNPWDTSLHSRKINQGTEIKDININISNISEGKFNQSNKREDKMKDCKQCLAFEEKEKRGHFKPYCDLYGMFLKDTKCPCLKKEEKQVKVKNLSDVRDAVLENEKAWLTVDDKTWVYIEWRDKGFRVWVNFGMNEEIFPFPVAVKEIYDFLTFKKSIDILGQ